MEKDEEKQQKKKNSQIEILLKVMLILPAIFIYVITLSLSSFMLEIWIRK